MTSEKNNFTPKEREDIIKALSQWLDPHYISNRPGPGGILLQYVSGSTVISLANEIFKFDGWSHSIEDIKIQVCIEC